MPDDLYRDARRAGLNVSQLAQRAVAGELDRLAKIAALDAYLGELEAAVGPVGATESDRGGRVGGAGFRSGYAAVVGLTLVLDSGGISMLAGQRARLQELRRRQEWPPIVPAAVLVEALTGDHRRDTHANRLLRMCAVEAVDEDLARDAARLRTAARGARTPSAVDAIVVARADRDGGAIVLTSDPDDLRALAPHTRSSVRIAQG